MACALLKNASPLIASLMMVAAHLEVAFAFCWIIVSDVSGYHNHFIKFLSRRIFVSFAKITYPMYLLSPIVTMMLYGLVRTGSTLNFPEIVSLFNWKNDNNLISFLSVHHVLCDHQDCKTSVRMVHYLLWSSVQQHFEIYFTNSHWTLRDEAQGGAIKAKLWRNVLFVDR